MTQPGAIRGAEDGTYIPGAAQAVEQGFDVNTRSGLQTGINFRAGVGRNDRLGRCMATWAGEIEAGISRCREAEITGWALANGEHKVLTTDYTDFTDEKNRNNYVISLIALLVFRHET